MKTTLMRAAIGAALALTGIGSMARAQGSASVDPATVPQYKAEFDRAAKLGVPVAPLVATARLGMMHSQPTNKIRDAIRSTAERYVSAREALTPIQAPAELDAGASALRVDIPKQVLSKLRKDYPNRALMVPIGALETLVVKSVPLAQALKTVEQMLKRQDSDMRIASLGTDIQGLLVQGLAPSAAFDALSRSVLSLPQAATAPSALSPQRK